MSAKTRYFYFRQISFSLLIIFRSFLLCSSRPFRARSYRFPAFWDRLGARRVLPPVESPGLFHSRLAALHRRVSGSLADDVDVVLVRRLRLNVTARIANQTSHVIAVANFRLHMVASLQQISSQISAWTSGQYSSALSVWS